MTPPDPDATTTHDDAADAEATAEAQAESSTETPQAPETPADAPRKPRVVLCPYCGQTQQPGSKCVACGGLFEPLSRRATQIGMGPWYLRDKAQPFRPGCSYPVLVKMIETGRIKPTTVLRGPTTRQFWSIARNVPGIAHLLGYCHRCAQHVSTSASECPHCGAQFKAVKQRNELGLQFPNRRAAEAAAGGINDAATGRISANRPRSMLMGRAACSRRRRPTLHTSAPPSRRPAGRRG